MNREIEKIPVRASKKDENKWVDLHDDSLMIALGMHPKNAVPRDKSVWTKSKQEKKAARIQRNLHKGKMHFGAIPHKEIPVIAKLIVYLKKNNRFPHTTYSTTCWMSHIGNILNSFYQVDKRTNICTNVVAKYVYNGKTYTPNERPFWR